LKDWTLGVRSWRYLSFESRAWSHRGWRTIVAWLDTITAAGIILAAFLLYSRTLLPGLGSRDTAEFQWVVPTLGLAHPTGYPLYTLLGWLWSQLPLGGTPAWRMNLFSAAAAALCVGVLYHVARAIGQCPPVAVAVALALATSLAFWSQATIAEVYALAALIQALLLLALLRWRSRWNPGAGRGWPFWPAGLLLGLGLAHHRTIVLMLPGMLLFVGLAARDLRLVARAHAQGSSLKSQVSCAVLAMLVGCLLYLYVPLRAPAWMHDWGEVWEHISGAELTGMFFDPARLHAEGPARPLDLARRFIWPQFLAPGAALLLLGVVRVWLRDRALAALLSAGYLAVVGFCAAYYVADIEVFFIPAHLLAALLLGEGAMLLVETITCKFGKMSNLRNEERARAGSTKTRFAITGSRFLVLGSRFCWLLLPALLLYRNLEPVRSLNMGDDEAAARQIMMQPLPQGALVVGDWYATEGPHYLQAIEGLRPDLQLTDAIGRAAILEALRHGRAVYLTKPDLRLGLTQTPEGRLWRVGLAPLVAVNSVKVQWNDGMALSGYTLPAGPYAPGAVVPVTLQWEAVSVPPASYTLFVHLVAQDGTIWGQHDAPPASTPTERWRPGERLLELCMPALKPDAPPGRYSVTLGWYEYPSLRRSILDQGSAGAPGADFITLGEIEVSAH
jgi:Protein O-mannosyl-transferase TMEM260-like